MYQMLSVSGTALSKACWDVLTTESQFDLLAALDPQVVTPTDGAVIARRDLSIADAYAFFKALNRKRAAALLGRVTSHGVFDLPLENLLKHQSMRLEKSVGSLVQWSPESLDACLRSPLHGERPKLVRLTPRGELISDRHCPSSVHNNRLVLDHSATGPAGVRPSLDHDSSANDSAVAAAAAAKAHPVAAEESAAATQSRALEMRRHSAALVSGPKRAPASAGGHHY
jgi:hypothetical protein